MYVCMNVMYVCMYVSLNECMDIYICLCMCIFNSGEVIPNLAGEAFLSFRRVGYDGQRLSPLPSVERCHFSFISSLLRCHRLPHLQCREGFVDRLLINNLSVLTLLLLDIIHRHTYSSWCYYCWSCLVSSWIWSFAVSWSRESYRGRLRGWRWVHTHTLVPQIALVMFGDRILTPTHWYS